MPWKYCPGCARSFNDKLGGCTNSLCPQSNKPASKQNASPGARFLVTPTLPRKPMVGTVATSPKVVVAQLDQAVLKPKPVVVVTKPAATTMAKPVVNEKPAEAAVPILQWHEPATPPRPQQAGPMAVPLLAEKFTMTCYRGEKSDWWPPPKTRLACGLTLRQPWACNSMTDLWNEMIKDMRNNGGGTPDGYAQYLRAEGKVYALATARSRGGAFEGYMYEVEIKNARTFYWGPGLTLGPPANFKAVGKTTKEVCIGQKVSITVDDLVKDHYIVLNADTIADSTILGFGHKTGTYEVTFFHDLPMDLIVSCNGTKPSQLGILSKEEVESLRDTKENQWAKALLR